MQLKKILQEQIKNQQSVLDGLKDSNFNSDIYLQKLEQDYQNHLQE